MIIKYSPEIDRQSFAAQGSVLNARGENLSSEEFYVLGVIDNPRAVLDHARLMELQNAPMIARLFNDPRLPLTTVYDDVAVDWLKQPDTWPVTLDSLVTLRGIKKSESVGQARSMLDVFCGSGIAVNIP